MMNDAQRMLELIDRFIQPSVMPRIEAVDFLELVAAGLEGRIDGLRAAIEREERAAGIEPE